MTDLHTHILPGMDDGAKDVEESVSMLRLEQTQGVDTVVLTPHFYLERETAGQFLRRRASAFDRLNLRLAELAPEERKDFPRMLLGAEVAWTSELVDCEQLHLLCIERTKNLLLELPATPWNRQMFNAIYDLMGRTGIMPVIAHLERYLKSQRPEHIREVLAMGVPIQVSAEPLLHALTRGKVMKLMRRGQAHLLATDCHNASGRVPNLNAAMSVVRQKLGDRKVEALIRCADELVEV